MTNYLYLLYIYFARKYTNDNTLCCVSDGTITPFEPQTILKESHFGSCFWVDDLPRVVGHHFPF